MAQFYSGDADLSAENFLANLREDVKRVIVSQHVSVLRTYAKRVVVNGERLGSDEAKDQRIRIRELLTIGNSLNLTDKQIVSLLFRGIF